MFDFEKVAQYIVCKAKKLKMQDHDTYDLIQEVYLALIMCRYSGTSQLVLQKTVQQTMTNFCNRLHCSQTSVSPRVPRRTKTREPIVSIEDTGETIERNNGTLNESERLELHEVIDKLSPEASAAAKRIMEGSDSIPSTDLLEVLRDKFSPFS